MRRQLVGSGLVASCALLVGCEAAPVEPVAPRARIDLRAATGLDTVHAVGVTVDAVGQRYLFDEQAGLYRLAADGTAVRVRSLATLPVPDVAVQPPFTDLVAVGPDRFALTAIADGFLLDLATDTMLQYFCYVPDDLPDDRAQRTDALTFDALTDRIYAQPRTYQASDPAQTIQYTQIAAYDRATGVDVAWHAAPTELDAGGMVFVDGALVIGAGPRLHHYDLAAEQLAPLDDLIRFGVAAIEGLAYDTAAATLLVLDGPGQALVELDRDQLGF